MYIIKFIKGKNGRPMKLPFKNLSSANAFFKTCIKNNWKILEFTKEEININF